MLNVHISTAMKPSFITEQNRYGISFFTTHPDIPVHKIKFCVVEFVNNSSLMWTETFGAPKCGFLGKGK